MEYFQAKLECAGWNERQEEADPHGKDEAGRRPTQGHDQPQTSKTVRGEKDEQYGRATPRRRLYEVKARAM